MGCVFTFLMVSFATQKLLILLQSDLCIFLLTLVLWMVYIIIVCLMQVYKDLLLSFLPGVL